MNSIRRLRELRESLKLAKKLGSPTVLELKAEIEKLEKGIRKKRME